MSACQSRNFIPKVVGSAWTPCVRPITGVLRYFSAWTASVAISFSTPPMINRQASWTLTAMAVSTTSVEVRP